MEGALLVNKVFKSPDEMITSTALIASLTTICHSQKDLLIAFVGGTIYALIRTYFMFGENSLLLYFKFNFSLIISLVLIYIFSRAVHQY